jgi:N-acetylglucosamine-6-phosphate deacetylase
MIAITAKTLFTPQDKVEQPLVLIGEGRISLISSRSAKDIPSGVRVLEFPDYILAPSYIDIHIHGGAGYDVMQPDTSDMESLERFLAGHGVGGYLPTTVSAPMEVTLSALDRLATAIEKAADRNGSHGGRAQPLGIHLEGPFLSHVRRGVHPTGDLLMPSIAVFDRLWQAARGKIALMTIAPELGGALEVIAEAARRGVCVSLGHSDADMATTRAAVRAGARHATHTFNAMRPLHHRDPGILGEVLTNPQLSADIIADGIHVDPALVKLFVKAKGFDDAVLITDAISATGMGDGRYPLGPIEVEVKNGKCVFNGAIAGSILTMDLAVRNAMEFAGCDLAQAVSLATANPARVMQWKDRGVLEAGARADLLVLDTRGNVVQTIIGGQVNESGAMHGR